MNEYKAPLRDIDFVLNGVLNIQEHFKSIEDGSEASDEIVSAILDEYAKFAENVLAPLNSIGDTEGCSLNDGCVTTPKGFKDAYLQFVEAGWPAMSRSLTSGGQGLPPSLYYILSELTGSANMAWHVYGIASYGAMNTIEKHGDKSQKSLYLSKLVEGQWAGTMCLTEPHCGSDLGLLRTKAIENEDGSYSITGTKIFISAGEHDFTENIVHIVLARFPDAPSGTKGISLFIVPKFTPTEEGGLGIRNSLSCGSIEHKMGLHGNSTCVMNFDGAKGYLIGEPNRGLHAMFTFMNTARIATAIQGLSHIEFGYQKSLAYSKDRLQMRSLSGVKNPDGFADPIIVHPDVRRMLLTQKAYSEGMRTFIYFLASLVDDVERGNDESQRESAQHLLDFLTPIAKAFSSEIAVESTNLGLQCFGGHGYVHEWGMEQNVRDARISAIWEGTTGIQALDLLGRKIMGSNGKLFNIFEDLFSQVLLPVEKERAELHDAKQLLQAKLHQWKKLTHQIIENAKASPDEVGAASVPYLMFSGYICLAYFLLKNAIAAENCIKGASDSDGFYDSKIKLLVFYVQQILPRTESLDLQIRAGANSLMNFAQEEF